MEIKQTGRHNDIRPVVAEVVDPCPAQHDSSYVPERQAGRPFVRACLDRIAQECKSMTFFPASASPPLGSYQIHFVTDAGNSVPIRRRRSWRRRALTAL